MRLSRITTRLLAITAAIFLTLGLSGAFASAPGANRVTTTTTPLPTPSLTARCTVTAASVPTCGRWWGEALDPGQNSLLTAVDQAELATGRRLDIVHTYHRWNEAFPTPEETALAQSGHLLMVGWKPITVAGQIVSWASIADGSQDATIGAEAQRLRLLRVPVLLSFSYEPEKLIGKAGTADQFAAAFRHIHNVMVQAGATNVRWVWTVMGLDSTHWHNLYHRLWPGTQYVDWIGWDPYNWASCRNETSVSFHHLVAPFYRWLTHQHFGSQPLMLAEYGTVEIPGAPSAKANWYGGETQTLDSFPRLKALLYFNLPSPPATCDWLSNTSTESAAAFSAMATSGAFRPAGELEPTAPG